MWSSSSPKNFNSTWMRNGIPRIFLISSSVLPGFIFVPPHSSSIEICFANFFFDIPWNHKSAVLSAKVEIFWIFRSRYFLWNSVHHYFVLGCWCCLLSVIFFLFIYAKCERNRLWDAIKQVWNGRVDVRRVMRLPREDTQTRTFATNTHEKW